MDKNKDKNLFVWILKSMILDSGSDATSENHFSGSSEQLQQVDILEPFFSCILRPFSGS